MNSEMMARKMALHERLTEELDHRVDQLFSAFCTVTGRHPAYGVERWDHPVNGMMTVVQDTSSRGCYDNETHRIPAILHLEGEDLLAAVREWHEGKKAEARKSIAEMDARRRAENEAQALASVHDMPTPGAAS